MAIQGLKPPPPDFISMKTSLNGLLFNVAQSVGGHYGAALKNLLANLTELKQRTDQGDMEAALQEFFKIYVVDTGKPKKPKVE